MKHSLQKAALVALMVAGSLGRAHAGSADLTTGFWTEVKSLVTYCKATSAFLGTTSDSDFFASVYKASHDKCAAVWPEFTCNVIAANGETYEAAFLEGASEFATIQFTIQKTTCAHSVTDQQVRSARHIQDYQFQK